MLPITHMTCLRVHFLILVVEKDLQALKRVSIFFQLQLNYQLKQTKLQKKSYKIQAQVLKFCKRLKLCFSNHKALSSVQLHHKVYQLLTTIVILPSITNL